MGLLLSAAVSSFSANITIPDLVSTSSTGWYGSQENQEVEPGMEAKQIWDLEAFTLDNNKLGIIGGYNFKRGEAGMDPGDIFLSRSVPVYGPANDNTGSGNKIVMNDFGYDYAIKLNFPTNTYDVYQLNNSSSVTVYYGQNAESNPWRFSQTNETVAFSGAFGYSTGLTDAQAGYSLTGGYHNVISGIDLSFLGSNTNFYSHYTMECGNDNLMGRGTTENVPEPTTMALFFTGLVGLIPLTRKKRKA